MQHAVRDYIRVTIRVFFFSMDRAVDLLSRENRVLSGEQIYSSIHAEEKHAYRHADVIAHGMLHGL
jgi:hypothetical protein